MPELVEQGLIYYACAPLYKIKEGKKEIYLETKKEYIDYVNKKILNKYNLYKRVNGEVVKFTKKELTDILNKQTQYTAMLDEISLKLCCPQNIIEDLALYYNNKALEKKIAPLKVENKDGKMLIKGLTEKEEFVCIKVDDHVKTDLDRIVNFFKREIKSAVLFYNSTDDNKAKQISLIDFLNMVYEDCTPKYRQRFKGLGEMNSDQLWETTLDPEKRTLIQLSIEDAEEAYKELEIQLGKDADKRKVSIRDNEDLIEVEALDR